MIEYVNIKRIAKLWMGIHPNDFDKGTVSLYVSGKVSASQIKMCSGRVGVQRFFSSGLAFSGKDFGADIVHD